MILSFNVNEKNQIMAAFPDNINGSIVLDVEKELAESLLFTETPYKYENNEIIVDTDKQQYESLENQVLELNKNLQESSDKIAEAWEYKLRDESIPADLQHILDDRASWRSKISSLQEQMNSLLN